MCVCVYGDVLVNADSGPEMTTSANEQLVCTSCIQFSCL